MNLLSSHSDESKHGSSADDFEVLIVEDEPHIRESLKEAVELTGHHAVTAANGREALRIMKKTHAPRLILLDLFMPVMSGYEFLEEIADYPEFSDTPIVIVSAAGNGIQGSGIAGFLRKPVDLDTPLGVVDKYCH